MEPTAPRACVFMVLAMAAFVVNDTLVKRFAADVPVGELVAVRGADIAQTAPFRFTIVVIAIFSGIFVFGEMPDRWVVAGIILIVVAGTYTLRREAKLAREADAGLNSQAGPNV
jgi:glucose uptake protein GlcU